MRFIWRLLAFLPAGCLSAAVPVTIASHPAGQIFTVEGGGCSSGVYSTPQTLRWTAGSSCKVTFHRPMVNDNGDGLLRGNSLASGGSIGNSQCTVSWGSAAVTAGGNDLTLSLGVQFTPGFGPGLIFYLAARDGNEANNTGWQTMGTWTVQ